ncbi:MAG: 23S rRNA (uracil(1939)-C(5))-methyltransferase RlmD [Tissierellia bacterium]|nr:23S rRNA (uracil(1939)-C(5))-methyltransferase RlmD [Tissierellia bacterium]
MQNSNKKEDLKFNIGDILELEILDINSEGLGVARHQGAVLFVEGATLGDRVEAAITQFQKNFYQAKTLRLLSESKDRVVPKCIHASECSGCQMQNLRYKGQLEIKAQRIQQAFRKSCGLELKIPIIPAKGEYGYRNKLTLKINPKGALGYHRRGSHDFLPITSCPIACSEIGDILPSIAEILHGKTGLEELMLRSNHKGEILLLLTHTGDVREIVQAFSELPKIISIYSRKAIKKGRKWQYAKVKLEHGAKKQNWQIGELEFQVSPLSFTQVNLGMTQPLYETAKSHLKPSPDKNLLDLYCGIGTTTLYFAEGFKKAIGVEVLADAVRDAKENAQHNQITNTAFLHADAGKDIHLLIQAQNPDTITVDPPRSGLTKEGIEAILSSSANTLVYISCDPATLARDCKKLIDGGYELMDIKGIDLFPQTTHVETVCLLSKLDVDKHIKLELEEDEIKGIDFKKDVTY